MVAIFEKIDCRSPKRYLLSELINAESSLTFTQNIHSSFIETLDFDNAHSDTGTMYRFLRFFFGSGAQQDESKTLAAIDAAVDHQFVAFFEYVERNDDMWE